MVPITILLLATAPAPSRETRVQLLDERSPRSQQHAALREELDNVIA